MIVVKMTPFERAMAKQIARTRNQKKSGQRAKRQTRFTDLQIHTAGMLAEIAFGNLFGKIPDMSKRKRGDNGIDFDDIGGQTVDVKARIGNGGTQDLLVMGDKEPAADLYVLVIVPHQVLTDKAHNDVHIVGYCSKKEVMLSRTNLGFGRAYIREFSKLHPIEILVNAYANEEV